MKKLLLILAIAVFATGSAFAVTFHITYPNGGEKLCKGNTINITWTLSGVTTYYPIRLTLWQNGSKVGDIANGIDGHSTSYSWVVGNYSGGTASNGSGYDVRIRFDTAGTSEWDKSDAPFDIKACVVIDPHKFEYAQKLICRWPPGCPGCPPEIDLRGLRERIGDPGLKFRLVLLKDGKPIQNLHSFGKGLPDSVSPKLGRADLGLLKNGKGNFALGLLGPDGKLVNSYALGVQ